MPPRLPAEWFWIERWMASSAFLLPIEMRGLYREMLSQAWLRGARLPNDHDAIRRAIGADEKEWRRCWPKVEPFWIGDGPFLINETQVEVYTEALEIAEGASNRGKAGARGRWGQRKDGSGNAGASPGISASNAQASREQYPLISELGSEEPVHPDARARGQHGVTHDGPRLRVWNWQHEDLTKRLGAKVSEFNLLGWYGRLEDELARTGEPFADPWKWLQQRLYRDAELPMPNLMGRTKPGHRPEQVRIRGNEWTCPHTPPCHQRQWCVSGARDERDRMEKDKVTS